jgi:threonine/homoserine/homoserine lactone efflux protein
VLNSLVAIVPSAGALFLFWLALRAILQADRRERAALARMDRAQGQTTANSADGPAVGASGLSSGSSSGSTSSPGSSGGEGGSAAARGSGPARD